MTPGAGFPEQFGGILDSLVNLKYSWNFSPSNCSSMTILWCAPRWSRFLFTSCSDMSYSIFNSFHFILYSRKISLYLDKTILIGKILWWWSMFHGHFCAHVRLNGPAPPPKVMTPSQRWNNLQICPRRGSSLGGSDTWSNALPTRPRRCCVVKER